MPTQKNASSRAQSAPSPEKNLSPWLWLGLLALVNLIGPFLPIPNLFAVVAGTLGLTLGYIALVMGFALGVARLKMSIPTALMWLSVSALVWLGVQRGLGPVIGRIADELLAQHRAPTSAQNFVFLAARTLRNLALLCGATFAGTILARLIRYPNMIGPIGAAIALIDIWGVLFQGPVAQMMNNKATKHIAAQAMAAGPKMGSAHAARTGFSIDLPAIGVGDFLFIALLLSVLVNLAMNWRTAARLMWLFSSLALIAISLRLSVWWPVDLAPLTFRRFPIDALPGLVFIGAGAVLPNWKFFKFTRDERFALLYAGVFVLILTIGLYFGFKSMLPHPK